MDTFDDIYKERVETLNRLMNTTKYIKDDNVPARIEEVTKFGIKIYSYHFTRYTSYFSAFMDV